MLSVLSSFKSLLSFISTICGMLTAFFSYKSKKIDSNTVKEQKKQDEKLQKKIEEVVDNGTLDDLINLKRQKSQ